MKTLLDYYKKGDTICQVRYGRRGVVKKVSKQSITIKLEYSTQSVDFHGLDGIDDFAISNPVVN